MSRGGPRPGAGRKRKDPALKLTGADRELVAASRGASPAMIPPLHLSDLAQLMFADIVNTLGDRAKPEYAHHIALLAQRLEQVQRFQSVLEMSGDTFTSVTVKKIDGKDVQFEMVRARPEVAMLSDAMRQAQSLIGELMLNPSAALRIADGHQAPVGEFDDF